LNPRATIGRPDRAIAAVVALALLLGGMPLTLGIVVHRSEAMFSLDICHPLQSFSHAPVVVAAIIPGSPAVASALPQCAGYPVPETALRVSAAEAPDPPPPKARA
jgi:hypothetical protein